MCKSTYDPHVFAPACSACTHLPPDHWSVWLPLSGEEYMMSVVHSLMFSSTGSRSKRPMAGRIVDTELKA